MKMGPILQCTLSNLYFCLPRVHDNQKRMVCIVRGKWSTWPQVLKLMGPTRSLTLELSSCIFSIYLNNTWLIVVSLVILISWLSNKRKLKKIVIIKIFPIWEESSLSSIQKKWLMNLPSVSQFLHDTISFSRILE